MINPIRTLLYELFLEPIARVLRWRYRRTNVVAIDSVKPLARPLLDHGQRTGPESAGHADRRAS